MASKTPPLPALYKAVQDKVTKKTPVTPINSGLAPVPDRGGLNYRMQEPSGTPPHLATPRIQGAIQDRRVAAANRRPHTVGYQSSSAEPLPGDFPAPTANISLTPTPPPTQQPALGPGQMYGSTMIGAGTPVASPVTGATVGMSEWGQPLTGQLNAQQREQIAAAHPDIMNRLLSEVGSRYGGMVPRDVLISLTNKIVNEGMPYARAADLLRQGYGINEDLRNAADAVEMEFLPQENAILRAIEMANQQREFDIGRIGQERDFSLQRIMDELRMQQSTWGHFGNIYDQRLQDIYGTLGTELEGLLGRQQGFYGDAQGEIGAAFSEAGTAGQEALQSVLGAMTEDATRLGLQEALTDPTATLGKDFAFDQNLLAQNKAGALSNLAKSKADFGALGIQGIAASKKEGAQQRANTANSVVRAMQEAQNFANQARGEIEFTAMQGIQQAIHQSSQQLYEMGGKLTDLAAIRGPALRKATEDIKNARTEREMTIAMNNFAMEMQRATLELQERAQEFNESSWEQEFNLDREESLFNRDMANREFDLRRSQTQFEQAMAIQDLNLRKQTLGLQETELKWQMQQASDPTQKALAAAQLEKVQAEIANIQAGTRSTEASTAIDLAAALNPSSSSNTQAQFKGQQGVFDYVSAQGISPGYATGYMSILNMAAQASANSTTSLESTVRSILTQELNAGNISQADFNIFMDLHRVYNNEYSSFKGDE